MPGPGDVTAIEGYAIAFRREDAAARGPVDEHFRFYRNLDIWWSLVLRDEGEGTAPRRAVAVPIPAIRHEHRGWTSLPDAERDRLSKRIGPSPLPSAGGRVPSWSCSSTSACLIVIVLPASPCTVNFSQPTRFCPKSTRVWPAGEVQISSGAIASCRTTGGPTYGPSLSVSKSRIRTPVQPLPAKPGYSQASNASRASMVSPS